jgi:hypothetical protein
MRRTSSVESFIAPFRLSTKTKSLPVAWYLVNLIFTKSLFYFFVVDVFATFNTAASVRSFFVVVTKLLVRLILDLLRSSTGLEKKAGDLVKDVKGER